MRVRVNWNKCLIIKKSGKLIFKTSIDDIPTILSETKLQEIGKINPNEEKLIELRFLPLKIGFNNLPPFYLKDKTSSKKFFFVHTNKININEN
jgi:hypothetical protein